MTQRELMRRAGSELFTIEVAAELGKRGHQVAVFCPRHGDLQDLEDIAYSAGVWIKNRLSEIPWVPDIIHGQHHLQAMAAIGYFPKVAAIYYWHGFFPWVEQPPVHPRIRTYVMMCQWMVGLAEPKFAIPRERVRVLPNFVNTKRFSRVRNPPVRPQRAVLFDNGSLPSDELARLERACVEGGLSLDKVGLAFGTQQQRPEILLADYDLAFAVGRCALEAMACGCAVIPVIPGQAGNLITAENFEAWSYSNFSPRYFASGEQIDTKWLARELQRYSPETVRQVTERVRSKRDLSAAIDGLEEIYSAAAEDLAREPAGETAEFAPYLEKLSLEVDAMWLELEHHRRTAAVQATNQPAATGQERWFPALLRRLKPKPS